MNDSKNIRNWSLLLATSLLFIAVFSTMQYERKLNGDFFQYLQPGGQFTAPANLAKHGLSATRFKGETETGWDGQFYYYLSDDPFLQKDTVQHLDGPKFRATRIGFPLFTNIVSRVFQRDWVSPKFYFGTSVLLIVAGLSALAWVLFQHNLAPHLAIFWVISGTILYSVLFGFTDAMADSFAFIAIAFLLAKRHLFYCIFIIFAVLTRENFAVVPAFILTAVLIKQTVIFLRKNNETRGRLKRVARDIAIHAAPIIFLIAWKIYLLFRFKNGGLVELSDFFGPPFVASIYFMTGGRPEFFSHFVNNFHKPQYSHQQAIGLFLFIASNIMFLINVKGPIVRAAKSICSDDLSACIEKQGLVLGLFFITFMYASFGPGMVWAPIGYVKASGFISASTLLICSLSRQKLFISSMLTFSCMNIFYCYVIFSNHIL